MSLLSFQVVGKKTQNCVLKHTRKAQSTAYNTLQSLELMPCPWKANVFTTLLEGKKKKKQKQKQSHLK